MKKFGLIIIVGIVIFVLTKNTTAKIESTKPNEVRPVPVVLAVEATLSSIRSFPGEVRSRNRVELAFSVPGVLETLNAEEGQSVKKGGVLSRLDPRDYQNAFDANEVAYKQAKRTFERAKGLREQNAIAESQFESTEEAYNVLTIKRRILKKAVEDSILRAPFNGVVARRYVENFEHIVAKQPIVSFQDISQIEVVVEVPEMLIAKEGISKKQTLSVNFDVDKDRWFDATVREFSMQPNAITRTYSVVVGLASPSGINIFPGMTATVKIETTSVKCKNNSGLIVVPVESVVGAEDGTSYIWVIPANAGNPKKVTIEMKGLCEAGVIISGDVVKGENIATAGVHTLRADMKVRALAKGKDGLEG